jgi:hypothetical protein
MYESASHRKFDFRKSRSACTEYVAAKREEYLLITHTFHVPPFFISLNVSRPTVFYLFSCFTSPRFTSIYVLPLWTFQISQHISRSFMFYLSTCFRSLHILSLCVFHFLSCFIFLRVSDSSIFSLSCVFHIPSCFTFQIPSYFIAACFRSPHVLFFDMLLIPPYFICLHVSRIYKF